MTNFKDASWVEICNTIKPCWQGSGQELINTLLTLSLRCTPCMLDEFLFHQGPEGASDPDIKDEIRFAVAFSALYASMAWATSSTHGMTTSQKLNKALLIGQGRHDQALLRFLWRVQNGEQNYELIDRASNKLHNMPGHAGCDCVDVQGYYGPSNPSFDYGKLYFEKGWTGMVIMPHGPRTNCRIVPFLRASGAWPAYDPSSGDKAVGLSLTRGSCSLPNQYEAREWFTEAFISTSQSDAVPTLAERQLAATQNRMKDISSTDIDHEDSEFWVQVPSAQTDEGNEKPTARPTNDD